MADITIRPARLEDYEQLGYVDALVMYQVLSDPAAWPGRDA